MIHSFPKGEAAKLLDKSYGRASILNSKRMTWNLFLVASFVSVGVFLFTSRKESNTLNTSAVISSSLSSSTTVAPKMHHFNLSYKDFMAFESVQTFLNNSGAETESDILALLPERLEFNVDFDLVHGEIGEQAASGFVAFNLACTLGDRENNNAPRVTASFFVIVSLYGTLVNVLPTMNLQEHGVHFCATKLRDPDTFLLGGNSHLTEEGFAYLLKWKEAAFIALENGTTTDCHDAQWSYSGENIWQPGGYQRASLEMRSAETGDKIRAVDLSPFARDINHAQLLQHDKQATVSSRFTNALIKVDMEQGEIIWVGSGPAGDLELVTLDGEVLPNGSSLFSGQHNAEYFGKNEYMIFDNQYDTMTGNGTGNPSRLLVVHVDETKKRMTERWSFSFHEYPWGYSPAFGDNDRLPTGNLLASFWPKVKSGTNYEGVTYDCRVSEIDRSSSRIAWEVKIHGKYRNALCEEQFCGRDIDVGWRMYSVERFYETPLVHNARCDAKNMTISFVAHSSFKRNNEDPGSYSLTNMMGVPISSGIFNFSAHWRPAYVSFGFSSSALSLILSVANEWGETKSTHLTCV